MCDILLSFLAVRRLLTIFSVERHLTREHERVCWCMRRSSKHLPRMALLCEGKHSGTRTAFKQNFATVSNAYSIWSITYFQRSGECIDYKCLAACSILNAEDSRRSGIPFFPGCCNERLHQIGQYVQTVLCDWSGERARIYALFKAPLSRQSEELQFTCRLKMERQGKLAGILTPSSFVDPWYSGDTQMIQWWYPGDALVMPWWCLCKSSCSVLRFYTFAITV